MKSILVTFSFLYLLSCENSTSNQPADTDLTGLELPEFAETDDIIYHPGFTISYNEQYENANWVAYVLTADEVAGTIERTDNFREDPGCDYGSAEDEDYKGSGYDRGHLIPAADCKWSLEAMEASFYYSNMSPQEPGFNRGIWKKLEEQVRDWALKYDSLFVVTGPIFTSGMKTIGDNQVAVPEYYYKALMVYKAEQSETIAFILPNTKSSEPLSSFSVSIDSLEQATGLDLFWRLSDNYEESVESSYNYSGWEANTTAPVIEKEQDYSQPSGAVQCSGTTKKGSRCKRNTTDPSGKCWQHK